MSGTGIGAVVARLRKEKGITQEVLAQNVGVSTQAVSKWETGVADPDVALLPPIAGFFGVTIDEIFGRSSIQRQMVDEGTPYGNVVDAFMDSCWNMQLDYFDPAHESTVEQREKAKSSEQHASRIVTDHGFTNVRTGLGFVAMPDPTGGWERLFSNSDSIAEFFSEIAAPGFLRTLRFLVEKGHYSLVSSTLEKACALEKMECKSVVDSLVRYRLVIRKTVSLGGEQIEVYDFDPARLPLLLVVLSYAQEFIGEKRSYYGYAWNRRQAFF